MALPVRSDLGIVDSSGHGETILVLFAPFAGKQDSIVVIVGNRRPTAGPGLELQVTLD